MLDNRLEIIVEIPNSAISTPDNPKGITRYNLDTFPPEEQEPIEINYCINDINDISNRNASSSKTITLPETNNNREVFGFISDLNLQINTFSPNKRAKCYVMLDTIVVLEGWLQLKNIKPNYRTGLTKLECVVYSTQLDFFKAVGESYLQDLTGFTHMTYTFSAFGITSSWFQSQEQTDIYYPLIDYGYSYDSNYKELSTSLNLVSIGGDGGSNFVNYYQMPPAVYLKSIIDAIFHSANSDTYVDPSTGLSASIIYQYDSNFFNSEWFKSLIVPYNNGLFSIKSNKIFDSSDIETLINMASSGLYYLNFYASGLFITQTFNPDGGYPTSNIFVYTGDDNTIQLNFHLITTPEPVSPPSYTQTLTFNVFYAKKGYVIPPGSDNPPGTVIYSKSWLISSTATIDSLFDLTFSIANGDSLIFYFDFSFGPSNLKLHDTNFTLNMTTYNEQLVTVPIQLNSSFTISKTLPSNVKQKDFLNTIFKMFNLYIDYDTNNTNILRIEPRDDYYYFTGTQSTFYGNPGWNQNNLQRKDWSSKVDINQEVNIQLLAETQNKTIKLSYKQDKDYFNDNYQGSINRIYGDKIIEIDNDFNFGEQVIDVLFGPTVLVNIPGSSNFPIANLTKQIDSNSNLPNGRSNTLPKIMVRGFDSNGNPGLVNLNPFGPSYSQDKWRLGTTNANSITYYSYPYAGNLNDPYILLSNTPELGIDLSFDPALYNYFNIGSNPTSNTIYNNFYKNQFEEILDNNSKIITAQLYLTPQDIRDFRFSDVIFLRLGSSGQYYHVNKINNYSLTEPYKTVEV